jgi:hypothetical protein
MRAMAWFLRAVERSDHTWVCRWGSQDYDVEPDEAAALRRLREMAGVMALKGDAYTFLVHRVDGTVERLTT